MQVATARHDGAWIDYNSGALRSCAMYMIRLWRKTPLKSKTRPQYGVAVLPLPGWPLPENRDLSRNRQIQTMKDVLMQLLGLLVPSSGARDRAAGQWTADDEQGAGEYEALQDAAAEIEDEWSQALQDGVAEHGDVYTYVFIYVDMGNVHGT